MPSALRNSIRVLRAFSVDEPYLDVTEISRRVELHKSTVSRILGQLEAMDLVLRDPESGYFRLGLGLIGLAGPLLANLDVRRIAYPALEQLAGRTRETSALTVWSGNESVSVEQVASPQPVKHTSQIGTRYTTIASASVRVFLAAMSDSHARDFLEQRLTSDNDIRDYLDRLDRVRENDRRGQCRGDRRPAHTGVGCSRAAPASRIPAGIRTRGHTSRSGPPIRANRTRPTGARRAALARRSGGDDDERRKSPCSSARPRQNWEAWARYSALGRSRVA